jgi:hypothetical protein
VRGIFRGGDTVGAIRLPPWMGEVPPEIGSDPQSINSPTLIVEIFTRRDFVDDIDRFITFTAGDYTSTMRNTP